MLNVMVPFTLCIVGLVKCVLVNGNEGGDVPIHDAMRLIKMSFGSVAGEMGLAIFRSVMGQVYRY